MKKILLTLIIGLIAISTQAQNIIAVQQNGNKNFYTNLDTAITKAQQGDTIYLPQGNFSLSVPIKKELHIFGIGFNNRNLNGIGVTQINSTAQYGYIYVLRGADNGSFEGIFTDALFNFGSPYDTSTYDVNNYQIARCYFSSAIYSQSVYNYRKEKSSNISIRESIMQAIYNTIDNRNWLVSNCVITNNCGISNSEILNCIFLRGDDLYSFKYSSIKNSVFGINTYPWNYSEYSQFYNNVNLNLNGFGGSNVYGHHNFSIATWDSIFINVSSSNRFDYFNNDYHLKNNSAGKNAGTDGTDIGIYGGLFPWKDWSVPITPQVYDKVIQGSTDLNGKLPIKIKVKAQTN